MKTKFLSQSTKYKKNNILIVSIIFFVFTLISTVYATDTEYYIRVGLEKSFFDFDELDIENNGITVGYKLEGDEKGVLAPHDRGANFSSLSSAKISKDNRFYIILDGSFDDFYSAENEAVSLRNQGLQAYSSISDPSTYAIAIGPFEDEETALLEVEKLESFAYSGKVYSDKNVFTLTDDDEIKLVFLSKELNPQVRALNNSTITISYDYYKEVGSDSNVLENISSKAEYRGIIEVQRNNSNMLRAINIVMLEEYLYSVVPSEMPSSWEIEALKAQTVAARNYVLTNKSHVDDGYDVCDTTHTQVYRGYISETERTTNAVNQTRGKIAYYNEKPINAYFFSSSGGSTANSEDVWVAEVPYLRGVDDSFDTTGKVWTRSFLQSDLTIASIDAGYSVGNIVSAEITETDDFGRVTKLTFIGTKGSFTIEKDKIRTFFADLDYSLESTNFEITSNISETTVNKVHNNAFIINKDNQVFELDFNNVVVESYNESNELNSNSIHILDADNNLEIIEKETIDFNDGTNNNTINQNDGVLELSGKGWGHGIGLSQHGANGMAKAGYTFEEILKHYYTDIEIK